MKFAALLSCVFACATSTAFAQTPAPQSATTSARVAITGWKLECDPVKAALSCRAMNSILQPGGGLIIGFTLTAAGDGKTTLLLTTPLGVSVRTPVVVSVPGGPSQTFTFLTCSQGGCVAPGVVNADLLAAMRAGKNDLRVTYGVLDDRFAVHDVTATIPLTGFAEVADHLK